ncbi:MAG: hypothetical protein ACE5DM_00590 [Candidatus Nanoarchaeia archaeon]
MEPCPNCKILMKVRREPGLTYISCDVCHYAKSLDKKEITDKVRHDRPVEVVTDEIHPLAVYPHKCKKCGFEKAQMISKGIWYSDEDECIEYVCGKCGRHEKAEGQKIT